MVTPADLLSIIEGEPLAKIWGILQNIWKPIDDVKEYYAKGEEKVNEAERIIKDLYFEVYDLLYLKIKQYEYDIKPPLIIMDGLSIREGNLLIKELKDKGYIIEEYTYGFSCLPSETTTFSKKVFNSPSPSVIKGDFRYEHVEHGKIPFGSLDDERFVIWITYPDEILHHAGKIIPPEDAFEKSKRALLEILKKVNVSNVMITSDHGYIFVDTVWPLSKGGLSALKSIFGFFRFAPISKVDVEMLEKLKNVPKDLSYTMMNDEYCYVKGRYSWSLGKQSSISHGGISFMECFVPCIKVKL